MTYPTSIFGNGLAFPIQLDAQLSKPLVLSEQALVRADIDSLLNTDISERPFLTRNGQPYGTRIRRALFSPTEVAIDIVNYECKRALDLWEPRIIVSSVQSQEQTLTDGASAIVAVIFFVYRSTNRSDNFVLPFRKTQP